MSELQRITNKQFVWGQKLKAQELNDIISVINNIIDYININESYWLKDEVGNGDSNQIVPTYYDQNAQIIARITKKNGEIEYLYAPSQINGDSSGGSSEGGDTISISSIQYNEQNGILLAILNVNGRAYKICAPKQNNITANDIISINPIYSSGKEIAEVFNKNGQKVNSIYIPSTTITSLTPTLQNGVEIAKYKIAGNSQEKILFAPAPSSDGDTTSGVVELQAIYPNTGEPIAQFKLAGATSYTKIYAPKNTGGSSSGEGSSCSCTLSVNNLFDETTGVQVATIIFNGDEYPIYAPKGSGGGEDEPVTYELYIQYEEEYGFNKYIVIYKHQGNTTSQEKRVSHTSGIAPEKDEETGQYVDNDRTMSDALTKNDPTTGNSIWDFGRRIEFEEFFQERTSDGEFTFTIDGEPKFIRCGTELQHHSEDGNDHTYDWKLKPGTQPGQGYALFDEFDLYDYVHPWGRGAFNSGLDINPDDSEFHVNSEGHPTNPPTQFEVYANMKQSNGKGIYKIGEDYDRVIEPGDADTYIRSSGAPAPGIYWNLRTYIRRAVKGFLKATTYDAVEEGNIKKIYPQSLEERKPNHMPREIVELPNHDGTSGTSYYYTSYIDCETAPDNLLFYGYTILRAGEPGTPIRWTGTVNDEDENGENSFVVTDSNGKNGRIRDRYALQDIANKYFREYLSDPEYYPSNSDRYRGYAKAFSRFPEERLRNSEDVPNHPELEYFFDITYNNGQPVTRHNRDLSNSCISLNEGDYFIFFELDETTISTITYMSAFASTKGKELSNGNWEFPDGVALHPRDYGVGIGEQWVIPGMGANLMKALGNDDWISFYGPVDVGEGNSAGGPNYRDGKNYSTYKYATHFTDPVIKKKVDNGSGNIQEVEGQTITITNPHPDKMYEEWVHIPFRSSSDEGSGILYRYGGNNYQIFAFRANKQLTLTQFV